VLLAVSCITGESGRKISPNEKQCTKINIDDKHQGCLFSEIIAEPELIRLETSDSVVIGKISEILQADGKIFILEGDLNRVSVFDTGGKYLYSSGLTGRGPQEILSINDIDIDREERLLLFLSTESRCLQSYDLDGRYKGTEKLGFQCFRFAHLQKGVNAFFINYYDEQPYNLIINGPDREEIRLFEYPGNIFSMYFYFTGGLKSTNHGTALYSDATSSRIYEISDNGNFYLKNDIDLGPDQWPEERKYHFTDFMAAIGSFRADFLGSRYLELDNLLYFDYMDGNRFTDAYYLFDAREVLIRGKNLTDDAFSVCLSAPAGLSDNGALIAIIDPVKLCEAKIADQSLLDAYAIDREELEMVKPGDNPLLFLYHFRKIK
jgi:hypothetical protein